MFYFYILLGVSVLHKSNRNSWILAQLLRNIDLIQSNWQKQRNQSLARSNSKINLISFLSVLFNFYNRTISIVRLHEIQKLCFTMFLANNWSPGSRPVIYMWKFHNQLLANKTHYTSSVAMRFWRISFLELSFDLKNSRIVTYAVRLWRRRRKSLTLAGK